MAIDIAPGERIIWQGQPVQGVRLAPQDALAIPIAAFWLLIVLAIFLLLIAGEATEVDPVAYVACPCSC
jgi:hypothetical protein